VLGLTDVKRERKRDMTATAINLTSTPAAPTGNQNVVFQASTYTPSTTSVSAYPQVATSTLLGVVKPDGTSITIADGVISSVGGGGSTTLPSGPANEVLATPNGASGQASLRALVSADLPLATTSTPGAVQPDGTSITISNGVISAAASGPTPATPAGVQNESYSYATDTGSANTYVVALTPAVTALVPGLTVTFKAATANTGASTLNVNGLGAKALTTKGATALTSGSIAAGQIVSATYDGTEFQATTLGSAGSASGTVTSVALTAPSGFTVSGSPVTTSGTLQLGYASFTPNLFLAGAYSGGSYAGSPYTYTPGFRQLGVTDLPSGIFNSNGQLTSPVVQPLSPASKGLVVQGTTAVPAPYVVQSTVTNNNTTDTVTGTFTANNTTGNTIIVVAWNINRFGTLTVSDTQGNTYTQLGMYYSFVVYTATAKATGANTVTVTSNAVISALTLMECEGIASLDAAGSNVNTNTNYNGTGQTNVITTTSNDLMLTLSETSQYYPYNSAGYPLVAMCTTGAYGYGAVWAGVAPTPGVHSNTPWADNSGIYSAMLAFKPSGASSSQTADLQEWQSPTGTVLSAVNNIGQFVMATTSGAPTNTPSVGACCFDPAANVLYIFGNSGWVSTTL
jgi:hypothetical protein